MARSVYLFDPRSNLGRQKEVYADAAGKPYPNVSSNHPLRNPIVNALPKILPATLNPRAPAAEKINNPAKEAPKFNDGNDKKFIRDIDLQITDRGIKFKGKRGETAMRLCRICVKR